MSSWDLYTLHTVIHRCHNLLGCDRYARPRQNLHTAYELRLRRSAVIYTFVEQVRRHGRDPFAYFEWVFEKLMHNPGPQELEALLPVHWIRTQESAPQTIEAEVA